MNEALSSARADAGAVVLRVVNLTHVPCLKIIEQLTSQGAPKIADPHSPLRVLALVQE